MLYSHFRSTNKWKMKGKWNKKNKDQIPYGRLG